MTPEQAIRILHPDTTREALAEIEYYGGYKGYHAVMQAVNDACLMGCEAIRYREEKRKKLKEDRM